MAPSGMKVDALPAPQTPKTPKLPQSQHKQAHARTISRVLQTGVSGTDTYSAHVKHHTAVANPQLAASLQSEPIRLIASESEYSLEMIHSDVHGLTAIPKFLATLSGQTHPFWLAVLLVGFGCELSLLIQSQASMWETTGAGSSFSILPYVGNFVYIVYHAFRLQYKQKHDLDSRRSARTAPIDTVKPRVSAVAAMDGSRRPLPPLAQGCR